MMMRLKQFLEFFYCQTGIFDNSAHCEGIDWIGTWDNDNVLAIRHRDVLAFAYNPETGFLKCLYRALVWYARKFRHGLWVSRPVA